MAAYGAGAYSGYGGPAPGAPAGSTYASAAAAASSEQNPVVQLEMSCSGLMNKDLMSKSDPFIAVFIQDKETLGASASVYPHTSTSGKVVQYGYKEVGRTETIKNTQNPSFATRIDLRYRFEELQTLVFAVYDRDSKSESLMQQGRLGYVRTSLGEVVSSNPMFVKPLAESAISFSHDKSELSGSGATDFFNSYISGPVTNPLHASLGQLTVRAHVKNDNSELILHMEPSARGLDKKDLMGKSDPYFVVKTARVFDPSNRQNTGQSILHKSEVIKKTLDPVWKPVNLEVPNSLYNEPIELSVWDWDDGTPHDLIGTNSIILSRLVASQGTGPIQIPVIHDKKVGGKKYTDSGTFVISNFMCQEKPTFLKYLQGGLRLNFSVGIDFTASNGMPDNPTSLHYMTENANPNQGGAMVPMNDYLQALYAVGQVLQDYDADRRFPAMGFGGKLLNDTVSFNFALNGQVDPHCIGIDGIVQAYKQALKAVRLSGPTNFAPLIRYIMDLTARGGFSKQNQFYNILMIITDGEITDEKETVSAIVEASRLPMSIIIVGVGSADFRAMELLDSDKGKLRDSRGNTAARDIVQFVPFNPFKNLPTERFSSAVLQELPASIVDYMFNICRITPGLN